MLTKALLVRLEALPGKETERLRRLSRRRSPRRAPRWRCGPRTRTEYRCSLFRATDREDRRPRRQSPGVKRPCRRPPRVRAAIRRVLPSGGHAVPRGFGELATRGREQRNPHSDGAPAARSVRQSLERDCHCRWLASCRNLPFPSGSSRCLGRPCVDSRRSERCRAAKCG
jgi:hypothetical protein